MGSNLLLTLSPQITPVPGEPGSDHFNTLLIQEKRQQLSYSEPLDWPFQGGNGEFKGAEKPLSGGKR